MDLLETTSAWRDCLRKVLYWSKAPFAADGDGALGIFADGDFGVAQGVGGTQGLDLVDDLLELQGQVLGERAGFLPAENVVQVIARQ